MINIQIKKEDARKLIDFLGDQDINDTRYMIERYELGLNEYETEDALQNLYDKLCDSLNKVSN